MPKLRLTRSGFSRAIATLTREHDALASQATIEVRTGDREAAQVFDDRAAAIRALRDTLVNARPKRHDREIAEVEIADPEFAKHVRDAAEFHPDGWRFAC
jgi:hypothetical protein